MLTISTDRFFQNIQTIYYMTVNNEKTTLFYFENVTVCFLNIDTTLLTNGSLKDLLLNNGSSLSFSCSIIFHNITTAYLLPGP